MDALSKSWYSRASKLYLTPPQSSQWFVSKRYPHLRVKACRSLTNRWRPGRVELLFQDKKAILDDPSQYPFQQSIRYSQQWEKPQQLNPFVGAVKRLAYNCSWLSTQLEICVLRCSYIQTEPSIIYGQDGPPRRWLLKLPKIVAMKKMGRHPLPYWTGRASCQQIIHPRSFAGGVKNSHTYTLRTCRWRKLYSVPHSSPLSFPQGTATPEPI